MPDDMKFNDQYVTSPCFNHFTFLFDYAINFIWLSIVLPEHYFLFLFLFFCFRDTWISEDETVNIREGSIVRLRIIGLVIDAGVIVSYINY